MYQKSFLNATEQVGHQTGLDFIKKLAQDAMSPKYRAKALTILWVFIFVVLAVLTLIVILLFGYIGQFRLGVGISTGIWAVFFGTAALFFLSSKWLTTLAGGILGIGANDIGAKGGNSLTQANDAVNGIAKAIAKVAAVPPPPPPADGSSSFGGDVDPFIVSMVWLFVIILGVLCIPAFFSGGGAASTNTGGEGGNAGGADNAGAGNP
jgi:uncharacterized membrane protein YgcG